MRRSIATVTLSGPLEDKIEAAARAGFDGIEIFDADLTASPLSPEEIRRRCDDLGLRIELFQPFRDGDGLPPEQARMTLRRFSQKLELMDRLGVRDVLVCSNVSPWALDDIDLSAAQVAALGDLAADHGANVHFEALAWGTHVNRFQQAWEIVRRADRDNVFVTLDTFHLLSRGDDASALDAVPSGRIGFVQIADAPTRHENLLSWSRHHRCFPGQGDWDLVPVLRAALDNGYRGPLSLEVFSDVIREAPADRTAADALRSLVFLEQQLTEAGVEGVDLAARPADPGPVSASFVEFTPGAADHRPVIELLTGLGFSITGQHRSKDVDLWTNGQADVVVSRAPGQSSGAVRTLGLSVEDAEALADRARALGWPLEVLPHRDDEVTFVATSTPSGLHILACSGDQWHRDFDEVAPRRPDGFLGIDHVGSPVAFTDSDAALSYWRTLFGLRAGDISEVNELRGWMRSRVIGAGTRTQVVLNVVEGRQTTGAPTLDQIAFAVPDVLAATRQAVENGVTMLAVPDNYYADLEARFEIDPELLTALRENRVMYDEDGQGAFLHAYTPVQPSGFYVELVQRIGQYAGFGSPNTPVRLVAQGR